MEDTFVKREQESVGDKTGNLAVLNDAAKKTSHVQ